MPITPSKAPRRRANYAGRNEDDIARVSIRMTPEEESRLEAKAEIAGIPPRAGSLNRPNLSEAARRAIEEWQPRPPSAVPATETSAKRKLARVNVQG